MDHTRVIGRITTAVVAEVKHQILFDILQDNVNYCGRFNSEIQTLEDITRMVINAKVDQDFLDEMDDYCNVLSSETFRHREIKLTSKEAAELADDLLHAIEEARRGVQVGNINITDVEITHNADWTEIQK